MGIPNLFSEEPVVIFECVSGLTSGLILIPIFCIIFRSPEISFIFLIALIDSALI